MSAPGPGVRGGVLALVLASLLPVIRAASAQPRTAPAPAALTASVAPGVTIDWTRGVVIARGVGPADRHAPEPAVARVAAERRAIDQARSRLAAALDLVPRTGPALTADARVALTREVALAPIVDRDLGTDGSVTVELGLGLEAVRQAATGPRRLTPGGDDGAAAVIVVDARATAVRPAVGLAIVATGAATGAPPWTGPVTFALAPPVGQGAARTVTAAAAGALTVDGPLPPAGARVVVVVTQSP